MILKLHLIKYGELDYGKKLVKYDLLGKCLNVIINMYNGCKSRISHSNNYSEYFPCQNGVRQGESLSLLLFALYLNDLEDFLTQENVIGLSSLSDEIEQELDCFLRMMIMLYADDTVLMSETKGDLQYLFSKIL